ncbi:MAG: fatty acid desaturase [Polyangiaceae bacterium]
MRYRADLRTVAFIGIYFGLVAVQWTVPAASIFHGGSWAIAVPLFVLTCFFSFFGAVATHNTIHAPVFHNRTANRIFQVVLTLTYGHPVSAFVPGHNLSHHKHTQTRRDVMRTTKVRYGWNLLNILLFVFAVAPAIMRGEKEYFAAMKKRLPTWFQQYRMEQAALFGTYIALAIIDWRKALVFVFLPHKYAAFGIISMNFLQHDGCDQDDKYNHSRNFVGKVVNFFTYNNGFHGIHHDHPGLHWSLAPAEHVRAYGGKIHPALEQKSLIVYLFKTFIWPGKRVTYDGKPVVLAPEGPDEPWVPRPEETKEDLGAIAPA